MAIRYIKGLRWWMMGLLMLGAIINYLTRSTLAVAAPTFMKDLGISTEEYALILNAFQATIMLQPLCGFVMDTLGLKLAMIIFATSWSLVTMAHGLATNWVAFAGLRGLLGLAEGSANPAGMKATAEWFPAKERGFAGGMYNIGASVGSMLAPVLVGFAIAHYSWQMAFVVTGAIGLVWMLLWRQFYFSRATHPALSPEEERYIAAGQEQHLAGDAKKPSVRAIVHRRNFWGIALPRFLADPTWSTLTFWLPLYLSQVRGFNLKEIALTAWLPFLAADLGCMSGGVIVAFLQRRGVGLINARKGAFTAGAIMMTGMAFVGFVDSPYAAVALLCLGGFAHQTLSVTVITMSSDLFKRHEVATVAGMAGTFGNAGILVFNLLIGVLVVKLGYTPFFIGLAALDLLGAVVLWTVVREERPASAAG
jgi:ACS family hexuronate transporter-like MFS transporter